MRLGPPKVLCKDPKPAEASGFHVERVTPSAEHRSDPLGWRHAGIQTAAPNTTGTTMKTTGSCALTPERKLSSGRDKAQALPIQAQLRFRQDWRLAAQSFLIKNSHDVGSINNGCLHHVSKRIDQSNHRCSGEYHLSALYECEIHMDEMSVNRKSANSPYSLNR